MKMPTLSPKAPAIVFFALLVIPGSAIVSYAQGRGNGQGAGPNIDKKCAKFVNCHDARDGLTQRIAEQRVVIGDDEVGVGSGRHSALLHGACD